MFQKNNEYKENLEYNKNGPYIKNRQSFNNNNLNNINNKNINSEYISPLRRSYDYLIKSNTPFQSENLTINKVSPSHVQYKPLAYDDGGYENYSKNINNNYQVDNKRKETNINKNPYNKNNIKSNMNQIYLNTEVNDNKYSNVYGFKSSDEKRYRNYLKNPYYKGEEICDGYKHYNPEENYFSGSTYGGYIYNYYLNAPMRSDKIENWRFPPLYYVKPKFKFN